MNLLIDMGNSRLKWAMSGKGVIQTSHALSNHQLNAQNLREAWADLQPQGVYIACVGATPLLAIVQSVVANLWQGLDIMMAKSTAQAFGVQNAYAQAEKLGVDRWLAVLAATRLYNGAVCVIDCGTAITIDVVDAQGVHQGGLISTGLNLMQTALNKATQQLPIITQQQTITEFTLANNTQAAIAQGTLAMAVGFIDYVMAQLVSSEITFLITGGDAQSISAHLKQSVIIDNDLVLRGLALIAEEN
ncbi:MAG: type III pantothenate kinase [Methylococcaceae bacterium]